MWWKGHVDCLGGDRGGLAGVRGGKRGECFMCLMGIRRVLLVGVMGAKEWGVDEKVIDWPVAGFCFNGVTGW